MLLFSSANLIASTLYSVEYELTFLPAWDWDASVSMLSEQREDGNVTCVIYIFLNITGIKYLICQFTHHMKVLQSRTKLLRKCHIRRAFFLTSSLYRVLPSPLPLEAMLLCVLKQPWSLDICRKQHWPGGRGIWYRKSVVVEIVLLRSIVCMEGYKFSSSFVRDCRSTSLQ